jgi:hypothetical protein
MMQVPELEYLVTTSVVARLPPSSSKEDISMAQICDAAVAIRKALTKKMAKVEGLQMLSRSGKAGTPSNQEDCFSSTSWLQFPLWDIRFTNNDESGCLDGFYGRPSYPLPAGDTYSSINVPHRNGGCSNEITSETTW